MQRVLMTTEYTLPYAHYRYACCKNHCQTCLRVQKCSAKTEKRQLCPAQLCSEHIFTCIATA